MFKYYIIYVGDNMNKNGWGLRVELVFIILFLICRLIAAIGLRKMGLFGGQNSIDNSPRYSYLELENKMNDASKKYFQRYYSNYNREVTIRSLTLVSGGYMSSLIDENGDECSGYTKVTPNYSGELIFTSYINCPNYKTAGYSYE